MSKQKLRVGVVGTGEVGRTTARLLASSSYAPVRLFDRDNKKALQVSAELNSQSNLSSANLLSIHCADISSFCACTDVIFVCVETNILHQHSIQEIDVDDKLHENTLLTKLKKKNIDMELSEPQEINKSMTNELMVDECGTYDTRNLCQLLDFMKDKIERRQEHGKKFLILRSTVLPGTTDLIDEIYQDVFHTFYWPEFQSRATADLDTSGIGSASGLILGHGTSVACSAQMYIQEMFEDIFMSIPQYSSRIPIWSIRSREAECIKLFGNAFYAEKIRFFQRIFSLCQKMQISYDIVRLGMLNKCFIKSSHTQVPGSDGVINNIQGPCLSKDHEAFETLERILSEDI